MGLASVFLNYRVGGLCGIKSAKLQAAEANVSLFPLESAVRFTTYIDAT